VLPKSADGRVELTTHVVLLAHGANVVFAEDDVSRDKHAHEYVSPDSLALEFLDSSSMYIYRERQKKKSSNRYYSRNDSKYPGNVYMPMEVALGNQDQLAFLLLRLGADVSLQLHSSHQHSWRSESLRSIVEFAQDTVKHVNELVESKPDPVEDDDDNEDGAKIEEDIGPAKLEAETWKEYWKCLCAEMNPKPKTDGVEVVKTEIELENERRTKANLAAQQKFWTEATGALEAAGAKTWNELRPDNLQDRSKDEDGDGGRNRRQKNEKVKPVVGYKRYSNEWSQESVPNHLWPLYDELFQACWDGDNEKIKKLCVPEEPWTGDVPVLEVAVELNADMDAYSYHFSMSGGTFVLMTVVWNHANKLTLQTTIGSRRCTSPYSVNTGIQPSS
jgi:hypothetical protein